MRLSAALPLVLLPLTLAHAHGGLIRPTHHRKGLARRSPAANAAYRRAPGFLDDLVGKDDDATPQSSSAAASSTTSSAAAASSAASSVGPSSAVFSTTKPAAGDTSTTTVQSALPTSAVQSSTTRASDSGSAAVGASASASGSGVGSASLPGASSVANGTDAASSTGLSSSEASSSAESSGHSSVVQATVTSSEPPASVQYTTDAAGQTQLITVILTQSADAAAADSTASATTTAAPSNKGDGGISTAAIIGISVGVGAAILALILLALWRMKRRTGDEDEAIRWPELNRHGDSDAHHALPAHQTGKHGIETSELERTLSNSSSIIYSPSGGHHTSHSGSGGLGVPVPVALNGSSFGAASSLEDDYSAMEKAYPPSPSAHHYPLDHPQPQAHDQMTQIPPHSPHPPSPHSHDDHDNYTSLPPPQLPLAHTADMGMGLGMGMGYGAHGAQTDDEDEDPYAGVAVAMPQPQLYPANAGYHQAGNVSPGPETVGHQGRYRIE